MPRERVEECRARSGAAALLTNALLGPSDGFELDSDHPFPLQDIGKGSMMGGAKESHGHGKVRISCSSGSGYKKAVFYC